VLGYQIEQIEAAVGALERQLLVWHNRNAVTQRLASIPGIGPILATAIITTVADPRVFRSRREFAACRQVQAREPRSVIGNNEERGSARNDRLTQSRSAFAEKPPAVSAAVGVHCRKSESPGQGSRVLPGALSSFGPPWFGGPAQSPLQERNRSAT
jgi:transposase